MAVFTGVEEESTGVRRPLVAAVEGRSLTMAIFGSSPPASVFETSPVATAMDGV